MYYYDAISLAAGTYDDNKIRIESNELVGTLDFKTRAERSQFDKAPLDSKKLGVYFSPQTMIDEDIIAQLGFIELDDYIGDPGETDYQSYPKLIQKSNEYWKKYTQRNDINAYIKIFTLYDLSLFRQLEQLLPARTDKLTGILVQPNILERSKDTILPDINRFNSTYNTDLDVNNSLTPYGAYVTYTNQSVTALVSVSGNDDDQYQGYLTASVAKRYNGTTYSYDYLILSGSKYITGSSPYWYSDAEQPIYITSVKSENLLKKSTTKYVTSSLGITYGSGTYGSSVYAIYVAILSGSKSETQDFLPHGINNQRYDGSKLTSPDFNINSIQTVDGGPVVEWKTANPNQLIYQRPSQDGNFRLV
jgi:hypothetical protein